MASIHRTGYLHNFIVNFSNCMLCCVRLQLAGIYLFVNSYRLLGVT